MAGFKFLAAAAVAGALIAAPTGAQTPAKPDASMATEAQVRELLRVTNVDQQLKQFIPQMIDQIMGAITQKVPGLPPAVHDEAVSAMKQVMVENSGQFVEGAVPIYQRNLTSEEIVAITAFVKTPAGKAFMEKQPKLMLEAMQMGQQVGKALAQKAAEAAVKLLQDKGYKI